MRRHYLDNIRWATVVLVVVYHVFYMFNACGVLGGVGSFAETQPQDAFLPLVYPWFMVLLFTVAGMSARYALQKCSVGEFVKSRTVKLLVPSTLGLLAYHWVCGLFYMYIGGGLEMMGEVPGPVIYLIAALSGTGPLWFAQVLWAWSLVLALIRRLDREDKLCALCGKAHPAVLALLYFVLWGAAQLGNVPVVTTYRFGVYGAAFFMGYFVFSNERMEEALAKRHLPLLAVALATAVAYVTRYYGQDYTADGCLRGALTNFYAYAATLAVLGCGKVWLDRRTPFTDYMRRCSFGLYVFHYLPVVVTAWVLKSFTALPALVVYPLCIAAGLAGGVGLWEVFRRVPVARWLLLGLGKPRSAPEKG